MGVDWAESHNDVLVMDEGGSVLGRGIIDRGCRARAADWAMADCAQEPGEVIVGIEIDGGLLVDSPIVAGEG